ncbi:MAG: extracellular solute-binding protein [Epulopiscium sp.]|nr:extracellular solute-binding protein [Candidatus Epulonipiscium sp.]
MKKILSGTALLIVIFCFFKFGGIHKNNISTEQTSNQREKLTLWAYYEVEAQQKSLDKLIKDFNLSQDTYFLSWEYVPMTDFTKRLSLGFTENELPDLVIIDNPDMFTYITLGLFEDITEYMSNKQDINDYYPEVLHSVIYNGRYYGLPFCSNNVALYYNKDLFKKAGLEPPKTWDEFKEAAYILTDEDTYGFAMCAMNSEEGAFQFLPWILSTGATIETIGDQNAFRAYKILQELISMGALSGECINWTQLVSTYAYRLSFEEFKFSQGAATANILFLILLFVGFFYIRLINEEEVM